MTRAVVLVIAVLAAAVAACVAEREADAPQPTVVREDRGERPPRVAAEAPAAGEQVVAEQAVGQQQAEEASVDGAEEAVSEAEAGEEPEPAYVAGTIQSGWRAGVRADRNMLGDPDAEIVITEWSDYQ